MKIKLFNDMLKQIDIDFEKYKNMSKKEILEIKKKLNDIYKKNEKIHNHTLKIILKENKIFFEYSKDFTDSRINLFIRLIKQSYENSINKYKKKPINNIELYLYITDTWAWDFQDLPFLIMSKPMGKNGILIPDDSFIETAGKTDKDKINWEKTKENFDSKCKNLNNKKNIIYFKGANTGLKNYQTRDKLNKITSNDKNIIIELNKPQKNIFHFCNYKYLLNLPGNQPWSYRFKYLFLTKNLVIDVPINSHFSEKSIENKWIQFFHIILKPDIDFIEIPINWYLKDNNKNILEIVNLKKKILATFYYYKDRPDKYDKIANSGYQKINSITMKDINLYYYHVFKKYKEIFY